MDVNYRPKYLFGLSLLIVATLILVYSPILTHEFAYHNDYRIWDYDPHQMLFGYLETRHIICIGRPVLAALLNLHLYFVRSMPAMQMAQLVSVLSITLSALVLFHYFAKNLKISSLGAALLAILMFTLPSMAINAFWVTNFMSQIVALWIAIVSFMLLHHHASHKSLKPLVLLIVGSLLYLDLMIYPPTTFFFLTLILISALFGCKDTEAFSLKQVLIGTGVLLSASFIYYLTIKFMMKPILIRYPHFLETYIQGVDWKRYFSDIDTMMPDYTLSFAFDLMGKLSQMKTLLIFAISAWFPLFQSPLLITLCGTILLSIIVYSAVKAPALPHTNRFNNIILISLLILLTALPCLAGPNAYEINYRVIFASMALVPALLVFGAERGLARLKPSSQGYKLGLFNGMVLVCVTFVVITAASTYQRISLVTARASVEYAMVHDALASNITADTQAIVVQLPLLPGINNNYLKADFGLNASDIEVKGLVKAALQSLGKQPDAYNITFGSALAKHDSHNLVIKPTSLTS